MYRVHLFLDSKLMQRRGMDHLPKLGDTMRFGDDQYGKVTEIIHCMDEDWPSGQRVNIRTELDN